MLDMSTQSRPLAREKMLGLLELSLAPESDTGNKVGEAAAWLLGHAGAMFQTLGEMEKRHRVCAASHALIACRHKVVFGMAKEQDLSGIVLLCTQLARIYGTIGEEVEGKLPPVEWTDPLPSWKALELGVVGAASEAAAAMRSEGGASEAQECLELGIVLLEMGAQMALRDGDEESALENWAAVSMIEVSAPDFDPMRLVPLAHFKAMARTLEQIASAYALGKDFDWAFSSEEAT